MNRASSLTGFSPLAASSLTLVHTVSLPLHTFTRPRVFTNHLPTRPFAPAGVAASIAASITHPLDLTKVRLQTSGDKGMIKSIKKTVAANGEWLAFPIIPVK